MKKIISTILSSILVASALAGSVGATGTLKFRDDFNNAFSGGIWHRRGGYDTCAYEWDHNNGYLYGQPDAKLLQTNTDNGNMWNDCYYSVDVRIQEAGLGISKSSEIEIRYKDLYESGMYFTPTYYFTIDIQTGEATLGKELYYINKDGEEDFFWAYLAKGSVPEGELQVGPDAPWFTLGMRVSGGKIQCYFNEKLILESVCKPTDQKVSNYNKTSPDPSVGSHRHPFVFSNTNNVLNIDNFEVWSGNYDFTTLPGDVNGDGSADLSDVTRLLQCIAKWENVPTDPEQLDLDDNGETGLSDVILLLQYIAGWNVELK